MSEKQKSVRTEPIEVSVSSDGTTEVVLKISSDEKESIDSFSTFLQEKTGCEVKDVTDQFKKEGSVFFSSKNWKVSYKPIGPRNNWTTPPEDPSRN